MDGHRGGQCYSSRGDLTVFWIKPVVSSVSAEHAWAVKLNGSVLEVGFSSGMRVDIDHAGYVTTFLNHSHNGVCL